MDRDFLKKKGISILEVIVVLVILGVLISYAVPNCIGRINQAKYERMINEMTSIAQASIGYYNSQYPNAWPNISQLSPKYLLNTIPLNPWGRYKYDLSFPSNGKTDLVIVSTTIPPGIAQLSQGGPLLNVETSAAGDVISISQSVPNEGIGRLQYEKKYTYNQ